MEVLQNFKNLFFDVWNKGISGINISEIIIALLIFLFFLFLRGVFSKFVVKRLESDEKTSGGIIIPDTAKEKPSEGEIVAVGPGELTEDGKLKPMNVKEGDKILFGKWSGTEVKLDGQDLLIMKESDIMGILE